MKRTLKNGLIISVSFGLYQMLIGLFFGTYSFVSADIPHIAYLLEVFGVLALLQFIYLALAVKGDKAKGVNKLLFSGSFIITALVGGTILWWINSKEFSNYFIQVASFLVASFLPSVFFLLYFVYKDAEEKISTMGRVSMKTSDTSDMQPEKIFHLENDNGKLLLEVPIDRIICYEANDNYVVTYYLDKKEQVKKSMERVSLKKIEELLAKEQVVFFRVHKSYLINPEFLEEIKGKAQAYKLQLRYFETMIPVSRSYDVTQLDKRSY